MKEQSGFDVEYTFVVGVMNMQTHVLEFVTEVLYETKQCRWKADELPLKMSKHDAIYYQMGLMCNGYAALAIEVPIIEMEYLRNFPKDEPTNKDSVAEPDLKNNL